MLSTQEVTNIADYFNTPNSRLDIVAAEQMGNNVLIMKKLDLPHEFNGMPCTWQLEYRRLSNPDDITSIEKQQFSYWRTQDWIQNRPLFTQFQLAGGK